MKDWHILGVGAIGSLLAHYLHEKNQPVTLLYRTIEQLTTYHTEVD